MTFRRPISHCAEPWNEFEIACQNSYWPRHETNHSLLLVSVFLPLLRPPLKYLYFLTIWYRWLTCFVSPVFCWPFYLVLCFGCGFRESCSLFRILCPIVLSALYISPLSLFQCPTTVLVRKMGKLHIRQHPIHDTWNCKGLEFGLSFLQEDSTHFKGLLFLLSWTLARTINYMPFFTVEQNKVSVNFVIEIIEHFSCFFQSNSKSQ